MISFLNELESFIFLVYQLICFLISLRATPSPFSLISKSICSFKISYNSPSPIFASIIILDAEDLFLRLTEKAEKIEHISRILYHWRIIKGSTSESIAEKSYAILAGQKAIEAAKKAEEEAFVSAFIDYMQGKISYRRGGEYYAPFKE